MREERIEHDGVPAKLYDPGDARGLLLLGHGGGQSKDDERFVGLGRQYAEETGLAVVCIDAVNHGERKPADATPDAPPQWHESTADRMAADWQKTVDALGLPALAYVGFSMGMIFGAPTVAAMPGIRAAVFGVGGIPAPGGREDPRLRALLLDAAARIEAQVLMLTMSQDEIFPVQGTHDFFAALPGRRKRLMFWEGNHVGIPAEAIRHSVAFVNKHTA
jgi:pimeloyl-ACP methyl ester carboxylesterase